MLGAVGPDPLSVFEHRPRLGEVAVDLAVKVITVGDDHERPVAGELPQDLLREEDHRVALAGALRVPEDAELALIVLDLLDGGDGIVHAEELVVLGDELVQIALRLVVDREVLNEVKELRVVRRRPGSSCPG